MGAVGKGGGFAVSGRTKIVLTRIKRFEHPSPEIGDSRRVQIIRMSGCHAKPKQNECEPNQGTKQMAPKIRRRDPHTSLSSPE